jgi:hypothetical protein
MAWALSIIAIPAFCYNLSAGRLVFFFCPFDKLRVTKIKRSSTSNAKHSLNTYHKYKLCEVLRAKG